MADAVTEQVVEEVAQVVASDSSLTPNTLVQIMCIALLVAITTEVINWFLIYRHDEYKENVQKVIKEQENVDTLREKFVFSAGTMSSNQLKVHKRRLESAEQ